MDVVLAVVSHWKEALAVVVVLGGLIFFHELGHFLMARVLGIGVRAFSLGFGPKLAAVRGGKTEYRLSLVPLGGYVSLAGEEVEENEEGKDRSEPESIAPEKTPDPVEAVFTPEEEFSGRPAWQRLLVVLAGPVANFFLAFLLYWGIAWMQGQASSLPEIGGVQAGSPAATAGLTAGDRIVSIDGAAIRAWADIPAAVNAAGGKAITIVIARDGEERALVMTPRAQTLEGASGEEVRVWLIGIQSATIRLGPIEAVAAGLERTWDMIAFTCRSIVMLVQRTVPLDNVGGPIRIAQIIGQSVQSDHGFFSVLRLAALISVNLGILNLLPIPVLDGGHIVFFLAEMLIGRPISPRVREVSTRVGMALLLALMVFATWNDITRLLS